MSVTQDRINNIKQRISTIRNDIESIRGVDVSGQVQNLKEIKSKIGELSVIKDKVKDRFGLLKTSLKEIIDDIDNIDTDEMNEKIKDILVLVNILDENDLASLNTTINVLNETINNDGSGNDGLGPNSDIGAFATTQPTSPPPPTTGGYKHPGSKKRSLKRTSKRRPKTTRFNGKSKRRPKTRNRSSNRK